MAIIFTNTFVCGYDFINKEFIKKVYQVFQIKPEYLIQLKQIQKLDTRAAKLITYIIFLVLIVDIYTESLAPLFVIKLENYLMIFSQS